MSDIVWSYRDNDFNSDQDLVGYSVMARDGSIGKIDESSTEATGQWLVVDTGFWIFGKKRLIPAGTVTGIDHEGKTVVVYVSKDQIKSAPDFDKDSWDDEARARHTEYYEPIDQERAPVPSDDDESPEEDGSSEDDRPSGERPKV